MADFTHFNEQGRAKMVDVGKKSVTHRTAVAAARVLVNPHTFALIRSGGMKKGDVLSVAQVAGIMGAKRTPDLIPMCHPVMMSGINMELTLNDHRKSIEFFGKRTLFTFYEDYDEEKAYKEGVRLYDAFGLFDAL